MRFLFGEKDLKYKILFGIILLIALFVRLIAIDSPSGLNYDELFFWNIVSKNNFLGIIQELINTDYHPLLYLLMLKFWTILFGDNDAVLRLLSVLFSTGCAWILYSIGKTYKNRQFGLKLMLFFAISLTFFSEAQTVRFYQMALFLCLLSVLFSLKLIQKQNLKNYIFLAIVNVLLLYTQTTGIIFIAIEAIILLIYHLKFFKQHLKRYLFTCLYSLIALIPQFIIFTIQIFNSKQTFWQNPWEWSGAGIGIICFINNFIITICPFDILFIPDWLFLIVICAMFVYIFYFSINKKDKLLFFLTSFLFCYTVLYYSLQSLQLLNAGCNINYIFLGMTLFLLTLFCILENTKPVLITILIVLHFIVSMTVIFTDFYYYKLNRTNFGIVSNYITEKNYENSLVFSLYGDDLIKKYNQNLKTYDINADKMFTMKNWQNEFNKIFDEDLTKYSIDDKTKFVLDFIKNDDITQKFKDLYNEKISKLNKDDYFIVLSPKKRLMHSSIIKSVANNDFDSKHNSKSLLMVCKLNNDILSLAYSDEKLDLVEQNLLHDEWFIFVFKKIK